MKIRKIVILSFRQFKEHHEIIFEENGNIPDVSFLVGDNGSGKTAILDAIYALHDPFSISDDYYEIIYFLELTPDEMVTCTSPSSNLTVKFIKRSGDLRQSVHTTDGVQKVLTQDNFNTIRKIILSTVETNFDIQTVTSITGKEIDDISLPNEKSTGTIAGIPQLLIDINNADNNEWAEYSKTHNVLYGDRPSNVANRLERFTSTFNEIYNGAKVYNCIRDDHGQKKIIFINNQGRELDINQFSTGEKQIIFRIGYLLKNLKTITGGIILIDEPEIGLHPIWQTRIKNIIKRTFQGLNVQIIIATHSPYIFQEFDTRNESCIKINSAENQSKSIALGTTKIELQKSTDYISYIAYSVVSFALHIELYTILQIQEKNDSIKKMEFWLKDVHGGNVQKIKTFTATTSYPGVNIGDSITETLPTYIRNLCHHGNETARIYNEQELKESIDIMLGLLK